MSFSESLKSAEDTRQLSVADVCQLGLFCASSFSYAFYMSELIDSRFYYISLGSLVLFCLLRICFIFANRGRSDDALYFSRSAVAFICAAITFIAISVVIEFIATSTYTSTAMREAMYMIVPIVIAFTVVNTVSIKLADIYVLILLLRYVTYFAIEFSTDFDISTLTAISWADSSSSVFESSFSHDLLVLELYFLFRQQYLRAGVAMVFAVLTFKRASFLLAPTQFIAAKRLRLRNVPAQTSLFALFAVACLSPFMMITIYSRPFVDFAARTFGVDIDEFTTGRRSIYELAIQVSDVNGFGSLNPELASLAGSTLGTTWNGALHNDTIRLYIEVGLLGVIVYCAALVYLARASRMSFIAISYTIFVLVTSRLITHMSFWIVLLLVLALVERLASTGANDNSAALTKPQLSGAAKRARDKESRSK